MANGLTGRIADTSLRHFLALRAGKPAPKIERTEPVGPELAKKLEGVYQAGDKKLNFAKARTSLGVPSHRAKSNESRKLGEGLVLDDVLGFGAELEWKDVSIVFGKDTYRRIEPSADLQVDPLEMGRPAR